MIYNFEWNPGKAAVNLRKHGVSFQLATEVFKDPLALTIFDEDNSSSEEERWVTLGQVEGRLYLVVVHTYRNGDESLTVRIISARPATKHEIQQYKQG